MKAAGDATAVADRVLVCGEVCTGILRSSGELTPAAAGELLRLRPDSHVRLSERPNRLAVSPDVLTGVDCRLPAASGARVRAIGTIQARAVLTEGRLVQATASFRVAAHGPDHRQPWGHYLVRPGVVEPTGRLSPADTADGFLRPGPRVPGVVDPGAVARRLVDDLGTHPLLDQRAPFKFRRTHLRWAAARGEPGAPAALVRFTLVDAERRTLLLRVPDVDDPAIVALCEDLARHDWLLSTLVHMVERSRLGSAPGAAAVAALRPAVDHLLHLWMPKARSAPAVSGLWDALEREPGFTRQWQILVRRIRDQLALQAIPLPSEALAPR